MQRLCTNRWKSINFSKLLHANILNTNWIVLKCLLKFIKMLMMNMNATSFRLQDKKPSSVQKCRKVTTKQKKAKRHAEK